MLITFDCSKCHSNLEIDATAAGSEVQCPACQTTLTVPKKGPGPGTTVGGFRIEKLLSKGGMGEVYLAQQLSMDRKVALKILPAQLSLHPEESGRFLQEVKLLAKLDHPHIVTAHEAGEDGGVLYLAMAYVKGESLEKRLKRDGAMTEDEALVVTLKLAGALEYAWKRHRLLHRDIKPANVLLDEESREPKLVDLGISKSLAEGEALTLSGTVMGTPNYMAPEQAAGDADLDLRADMYSLGVTLYHMLSGKMPFGGRTMVEVLHRQATESLADPRACNDTVSEPCVALLEVMLAKAREARHESWEALIEDLKRVMQGEMPARQRPMEGGSTLVRGSAEPGGAGRKMASHGTGVPPAGGKPGTAVRAGAPKAERPSSKARMPLFVAAGAVVAIGAALGVLAVARRPQPPPATPAVDVAPATTMVMNTTTTTQMPAETTTSTTTTSSTTTTTTTTTTTVRPQDSGDRAGAPSPVTDSPAQAGTTDRTETSAKMAAAAPAADLARVRTAVAKAVLEEDFNSAIESLRMARAENPASARELDALAQSVSEVSRMGEVILASFQGDAGKTVAIGLKQGTETCTIRSASDGKINVEQIVPGASIQRTFVLADLSITEEFRRLGTDQTPEREVMRGLLAHQGKAPDKAREFFGLANDPLGKALIAFLDETASQQRTAAQTQQRAAAEATAMTAFRSILASAGIDDRETDVEKLVVAIQKRKCTQAQVEQINTEVEAFRAKHAATDTAARNGRVLRVLELLRPNLTLYVDQAVWDAALAKLKAANPGGDVTPAVTRSDDGLHVSFQGRRNLSDISALAGIPIVSLDLLETQVYDFRPLRGAPLQRVRCGGDGSPALGGLAGLPLTDFTCIALRGSCADLQWTKGMRLTNVFIRMLSIGFTDLGPLKGMPLESLQMEWIGRCALADLSALKGMPLSQLRLVCTRGVMNRAVPLSSLQPLAGMTSLQELALPSTSIADLRPLTGIPLVKLNMGGTAIRDLSPLRGMPLRSLNINGTPVTDLSPLKDMPLTELRIRGVKADASVLTEIKTLKTIER